MASHALNLREGEECDVINVLFAMGIPTSFREGSQHSGENAMSNFKNNNRKLEVTSGCFELN